MAKNVKGVEGKWVALIVIVAIVGVVWMSSHGTTLSVSGVTSPSSSSTNLNSCGSTSTLPTFLLSDAYPDYTQSPNAAGAYPLTVLSGQSISVYPVAGSGFSSIAQSSVTSGSAGVASAGLNCGGTYLIAGGDQSTVFFNTTGASGTQLTMASQPETLVTPKYSAPTITASSSVQSTPTAQAVISSVSASKTVIGYLVIQAGQYTASEGSMALSFAYNSSAIQSISIAGLGQSSASVPSMSFATTNAFDTSLDSVGSQNTQVTFLLPSISDYQYSSGTGSSIGAYMIPVQITTSSAYGGNELISTQITPGTDYFNKATGVVQTDVFKNPSTGGDLFTPVVANSIVLEG